MVLGCSGFGVEWFRVQRFQDLGFIDCPFYDYWSLGDVKNLRRARPCSCLAEWSLRMVGARKFELGGAQVAECFSKPVTCPCENGLLLRLGAELLPPAKMAYMSLYTYTHICANACMYHIRLFRQ